MKAALLAATLVAGLCLAQSVSDKYIKRISKYIDECSKELSIERADIAAMMFEQKKPVTKEERCAVECFLKKSKYLLQGGKIDWNATKETNKEKFDDNPALLAKANQVADICAEKVDTKGKGECEIGAVVLECVYAEAKTVGLPPPNWLKANKPQSAKPAQNPKS